MAKRPSITNVTVGDASAPLNTNFQRIAEQFDNTLSRDGSGPNQLNSDLDMNGNDLLNVKQVDTIFIKVNGTELTELIDETFDASLEAKQARDESVEAATNSQLSAAYSEQKAEESAASALVALQAAAEAGGSAEGLAEAVQAAEDARDASQTFAGQASDSADDAADSAVEAAGIVSSVNNRIDSVEQKLAPLVVSRGDALVLAEIDGVPQVGLSINGELLAKFPPRFEPNPDAATMQQVNEAVAVETQNREDAVEAVSDEVEELALNFEPSSVFRGEGMIIAEMDGIPVVGLSSTGELLAHFPDDLGREAAQEIVDEALGPTTVVRGEGLTLAEMDGVPILGFNAQGQLLAHFPDDLINPPDGGATPESPDIVGDQYDAWNVWNAEGTVYFTTHQIYGNMPREYVRRGMGQPWANGPSRTRLRLTYGDQLSIASALAPPTYFAHIGTLNDGAGEFGLDGQVPTTNATDLARTGAGYSSAIANEWLKKKQGALPWIGVRSEGVTGATLADLRVGQPMLNLKRALDQFTSVVEPYGRTVQVDAVSILHGVADNSTSYASDLLQLVEDVITETQAIRVNVMQPSGTWSKGDYASSIGTVEALRQKGMIPLTVVSPLYWTALRSGTFGTPTPTEMTNLAELEALSNLSPTEWYCPMAYAATRDGVNIDVDFEVMPGNILVANSVQGLQHSGSTIVSATVVANPLTSRLTRLRVVLQNAVAGNLTYKFSGTGNNINQLVNFGSNLTDDWTATGSTGATLRRHAYSFQFEVN